jgi:hypothetical protein
MEVPTLGTLTFVCGAGVMHRRRPLAAPGGAAGDSLVERPGVVLLLVAHPDDESMFFVPTIRHLMMAPGVTVHLMSVSTGKQIARGGVMAEPHDD